MRPLDALIDAFLDATRHTLRPNTRRAYRYDLALFARSLPALDVADLTIDHLRAFLAATADRAPATLARRRAALRSCFAWAYRNDLIPADPTGKLDKITLPQRDPRPLDAAVVEALLAAIPAAHARDRLLFTLLRSATLPQRGAHGRAAHTLRDAAAAQPTPLPLPVPVAAHAHLQPAGRRPFGAHHARAGVS